MRAFLLVRNSLIFGSKAAIAFYLFLGCILMGAVMIRLFTIFLTATFFLLGCASVEEQEQGKRILFANFDQFITKLKPLVKYDPYKDKIYYDRAAVKQLVKDFRYENALMEVWRGSSDSFKRKEFARYMNRDFAFSKSDWETDLYNYRQNKGWIISRSGFTDGDRNFGQYSVPVFFYLKTNGRHGVFSLGKVFNIEQGVTTKQNVPAASKSVADKLKELKALLDQELITPQDYETKKNALLDSM